MLRPMLCSFSQLIFPLRLVKLVTFWLHRLTHHSRRTLSKLCPRWMTTWSKWSVSSTSNMNTHLLTLSPYSDILSFYKEEIHRESLNQISQIAHREGITKIQCMRNMLRDQVQRQQRTKAILSYKNPHASDVYTKHFLPGYVRLHVACRLRYKLDDLNIV